MSRDFSPIHTPLFVHASAFAQSAAGIEEHFSPKDLRRLDDYTKLALLAAARTLKSSGMLMDSAFQEDREEMGLIIASGYGPVRKTCAFMDSIIDDGVLCASPLAFSASVHNVAETHIALLLGLRGPCLCVSQFGGSFASALLTARSWLLAGRCKRVLLGAVDEVHPVCEAWYPDAPQEAGAAFFLLSLADDKHCEMPAEIFPEPSPATHPSQAAFDLAQRLAAKADSKPVPELSSESLLTLEEIRRIAGDFIRTELARFRRDVFSVFSSTDPERLLGRAEPEIRQRILQSLLLLFDDAPAGSPSQPDSLEHALELCAAALRRNRWFNFRTSGSTGEPVDCRQSDALIREEAEGIAPLFMGIRRVVSLVPTHHAYGFAFALQLPRRLGIPVETRAALPTSPWAEWLREGDLLVAFPLFLRQLMACEFRFPPGVTVLTATAPCPDALHETLRRRGLMQCVEIYGASEGGAVAWREAAGEPFRLLPFWEGEIAGGLLEKIRRRSGALTLELPDIAPVENAGISQQSGCAFRLAGRKDKAVQVAGINVYPAKVEAFLRRHPLVKEAAVRLDGAGSGHLKAFVVLRESDGSAADENAARAALHQHLQALSAHEIPRKIRFGAALPVTAFGKKADW